MRKMAVVLLCFILIFTVSSCGSPSEADLLETRNTDISPDLTFDHSMPLDYAEEFAVDYYNDGYALITISYNIFVGSPTASSRVAIQLVA